MCQNVIELVKDVKVDQRYFGENTKTMEPNHQPTSENINCTLVSALVGTRSWYISVCATRNEV